MIVKCASSTFNNNIVVTVPAILRWNTDKHWAMRAHGSTTGRREAHAVLAFAASATNN